MPLNDPNQEYRDAMQKAWDNTFDNGFFPRPQPVTEVIDTEELNRIRKELFDVRLEAMTLRKEKQALIRENTELATENKALKEILE